MRRVLGLAVAVIAVAGALTGCGGGAQSDVVEVVATAAFLSEAADRTTEDATGRFEGTMHFETDPPDDPSLGTALRIPEYGYSFDTVGVYDTDAGLVQYDATTRYEGRNFPDGGLEGQGQGVEEGRTGYLRGFPFSGPDSLFGLDEGAWVVVEVPEEISDAFGAPETGTVSPSQQLDVLREHVVDIEEVGTEDVRGIATTHLEAAYVFPDEALELLEEGGVDDPVLGVDVWVDDQGRVRRLTSSLSADHLSTTSTIEYFDFGIEVDISVPEDTTPLEDLPAPQLPTEPELTEDQQQEIDEQVEEELGPPPPGTEDLVEQMSELTPEQLAEDPCQAFDDDPELQAECEMYLG
jgi:hypothetical protein